MAGFHSFSWLRSIFCVLGVFVSVWVSHLYPFTGWWTSCCGGLAAQSCLTLCSPMDCNPPGFSVHGDFPGKNTGVGCHFLLQGSSQSRGRTWVSCISRQIFYHLSFERSREQVGCFLILAIVNSASWILGCIYLFELVFSFSSDVCPGI